MTIGTNQQDFQMVAVLTFQLQSLGENQGDSQSPRRWKNKRKSKQTYIFVRRLS